MQYRNIVEGRFLSRPNRFIAFVETEEGEQICHVKNTGRCKELLLPGATVYLEKSGNPERKTAWDLVAVRKGERLFNMDSSAPNAVAGEYLMRWFLNPKRFTEIREWISMWKQQKKSTILK